MSTSQLSSSFVSASDSTDGTGHVNSTTQPPKEVFETVLIRLAYDSDLIVDIVDVLLAVLQADYAYTGTVSRAIPDRPLREYNCGQPWGVVARNCTSWQVAFLDLHGEVLAINAVYGRINSGDFAGIAAAEWWSTANTHKRHGWIAGVVFAVLLWLLLTAVVVQEWIPWRRRHYEARRDEDVYRNLNSYFDLELQQRQRGGDLEKPLLPPSEPDKGGV